MAELATIQLQHPIEVGNAPKSALVIRRRLCTGALAAVQRYARRHGIRASASDLLWGDAALRAEVVAAQAEGRDVDEACGQGLDLGAWAVLLDYLCCLPDGTCEQLQADDLNAAMVAAGPFLAPSDPGTSGG